MCVSDKSLFTVLIYIYEIFSLIWFLCKMVIIDLVKLYMFIDLFISHSVKRTISLRNLINKLRLFNTKKKVRLNKQI